MQRFFMPEGLVWVRDQQPFLVRGLLRGAGEHGDAAHGAGEVRGWRWERGFQGDDGLGVPSPHGGKLRAGLQVAVW